MIFDVMSYFADGNDKRLFSQSQAFVLKQNVCTMYIYSKTQYSHPAVFNSFK